MTSEDLLYFGARQVLAVTRRCAVANWVFDEPLAPGRRAEVTIPVMISTLMELMSDGAGEGSREVERVALASTVIKPPAPRLQAPLVYTIQHLDSPVPQAAFSVSSTPLDSLWMHSSFPSTTEPSQTVPTPHAAAPCYL